MHRTIRRSVHCCKRHPALTSAALQAECRVVLQEYITQRTHRCLNAIHIFNTRVQRKSSHEKVQQRASVSRAAMQAASRRRAAMRAAGNDAGDVQQCGQLAKMQATGRDVGS
eukprot:357176-Chlamydomonas_euryale.AAC.1